MTTKIENDHQLGITLTAISKFERALKMHDASLGRAADPEMHKLVGDAITGQLETLRGEVREYEAAKLAASASTHAWETRRWSSGFELTCCANCGVVRRSDGRNKPCRGPVAVGPR